MASDDFRGRDSGGVAGIQLCGSVAGLRESDLSDVVSVVGLMRLLQHSPHGLLQILYPACCVIDGWQFFCSQTFMSLSSPGTNPTLLLRVRTRDDQLAWNEFVELYTPLVYGYLKRCRIQDADALDLTQEVMLAVNRHIGGFDYDPGKGRFRGWLQTITRNKARSFFDRQKRRSTGAGGTAVHELLQQQADPTADPDVHWEEEYRQRTYEWALERVRDAVQPQTLQAFLKTAIENCDPGAVATELGMTTGAVYLARARVTMRLREQIDSIGDC